MPHFVDLSRTSLRHSFRIATYRSRRQLRDGLRGCSARPAACQPVAALHGQRKHRVLMHQRLTLTLNLALTLTLTKLSHKPHQKVNRNPYPNPNPDPNPTPRRIPGGDAGEG